MHAFAQIPLHDQNIIVQQNEQCIANHNHSEKAKAPILRRRPTNHIIVGDLVYLFSDCNKTRARDLYLVVEVTGSFCNIRKFVGSQLQSTSFRVKTSPCYRVPSEVTDFQPSTVILTPHLMKPFQLSQYLPILLHLSYQVQYQCLLLKRFPTSTFLLTNMSPSKTVRLIQFQTLQPQAKTLIPVPCPADPHACDVVLHDMMTLLWTVIEF